MKTARLPSGDTFSGGRPGVAAAPRPTAATEAASAASRAAAGGRAFIGAGAAADVAGVVPAVGVEGHRVEVVGEFDRTKGQRVGGVRLAGHLGQRGSEPGVIERGFLGPVRGIDEQELGALRRGLAVPEAVAGHPDGTDEPAADERAGVEAQELLGVRVVGGGNGPRVLRGDGGGAGGQHREQGKTGISWAASMDVYGAPLEWGGGEGL